ncbi:translation initiation factor IF-2 [Falseniella ignava]|uniref:Translation initiation factor IF-2 n=1 Tax=Falseniella ignava CCUG 37419 TaxID=883112 RepID=K1LS36_9LACT|nr:translation initiation factor IF-2 [Falseniella ignava]EKB57696.1 translation initiation factor IF-2 [Falseniella ignava CCUG 37419]
MSKRVYEFAKEINRTSKEVLAEAKKLNIDFGSHMSAITPEQEKSIKQAFSGAKQAAPAEKPKAKKETTPTQAKSKKTSNQKAHQSKSSKKNDAQGSSHKREDKKHRRDHRDERNESANDSKPKNQKNNKRSRNQQEDTTEERSGGNRRNRRNRRNRNKQQKPTTSGLTERKHKELPEKLIYTEGMNIQDIAKIFHRDATEIIKKLMMNGVMVNQNQALSKDVIELIAIDYGVEPEEKVVVDTSDLEIYFEEEDNPADLQERPAVVTIMGHVDHGKTTLLDQIRKSHVTAGEAGGITQHIGAYQVKVNNKPVTFLDTPGHEAFTTMRARGADVTDIVIIVVAADDGVMPQTVEAINHAKAADVPILIAVNKMDKPTANPDRVKQELAEHGIIPEDWGGDNIFVEISARENLHVDDLLEMVQLVAEVQELKANPNKRAIGTVIEARLDQAQGSTATLLVQNGTMKVGDPIVVGNTYGRVRTMVNDHGRRIQKAGPATPVEITGLNDAPQAGDLFAVFEDEKSARAAGELRKQQAQEKQRQLTHKVTLDNLFDTLQEGELKSVNVIIKADVQGSVEALASSLQKIEVEGVKVNVVHKAVGGINESDVTLASASGAVIIGFNVRPTPQARQLAEEEEIDIRLHRVIYSAIDEVETAMKGMLDPEYVEEIQGQAIVRETFTVSKLGTIAGSFVTDGKVTRSSLVRLIRDNIVIYEGELASLKRFQDDAKEVAQGYECGIMLENYNDFKVDDIIEAYHMVEVKK